MKLKTRESAFLKSILKYLAYRGVWHMRLNTGGMQHENRFIRFCKAGTPDIIATSKDGRVVWIEVKAEGRKQSDEQIRFETLALQANHTYLLAVGNDGVKIVMDYFIKH
jgi:hypothetical protein